jgi:predicted homoserine dehydrogenase-like protein
MNLAAKLKMRAEEGRPILVGLIGAGKFGTMFLAQARLTAGLHVTGLADLSVVRAQERLRSAGYESERLAPSLSDAVRSGGVCVTDDAMTVISHPAIEVIVEATGDAATGAILSEAAIRNGKHIVMANVEADALAGPLLARKAGSQGVVYSLAWGDQPALICEHVDWARACGFTVVAAGKGTRYLPAYHDSNPDTVWDTLVQYLPISDRSHVNPKMFNSFLDGTKSAIEMTAVCNAAGLVPQTDGLTFPPASRFELADVCKPRADGGTLEKSGVTEVVSSLYRDGRDVPHHLAMGTYVVITSESEYARQCFKEYNALPDTSGRYAALYRPIHMIGLELGISVASAALRGEPTGSPHHFNSDVVAVAKRDLKVGEVLDGEGGFTVWGKQMPARQALAYGAVPIGLASDVTLTRAVTKGEMLRKSDLKLDQTSAAARVRCEMETAFYGSEEVKSQQMR